MRPERMTTKTRARTMRVFAIAPAAIVLLAACAAPKATPSVAPPSAVGSAAPSVAASAVASAAPSAAGSAVASAAASQPASSGAAGGLTLATATGPLGTYLTGKNGLTLYYFTKDTAPDATVCTDAECRGTWPPVTVSAGGA